MSEPLLSQPSREAKARHGRHWMMIGMVAGNYAMMDLNTVLLYFMLSESNLGCNYKAVYSQMNTIVLCIMLAWRPLSGWITDVYAFQQHWMLLACSLTELLMLVAMLVVIIVAPGFHPWSILGFQMVKQLVETQLYNSIWKILKMRIAFRYKVKLGEQCAILSSVGIWGECIETSFNMLCCGLSYAMITRYNMHFSIVRYFYFATTGLASFLCVTLSVMIILRKDYFSPFGDGKVPPHLIDAYYPGSPRHQPVTGPAELMQDEDSKDLDDVTSDTPLEEIIMSKVHQGNHGSGRDVVGGDSIGPWRRLVRYVKSSTAALWQNLIARRVIFHSLLVYVTYSIQGNAEYMAVPGRHVDKEHKTLHNFCGGYLTNLVYQDVIMNGVFVAGTFFYLLVLKRIKPSDYYKIGFPIMGVVLAVITSLLLFNLSQTLLSVAMAIAMALGWYLFLYDNYVALAAISHVHYGFYSFVNGYVQNLTDVFTFVLMYVNTPNAVFITIAYSSTAASVLYGIWFFVKTRRLIEQTNKGYC